MHRRKLKFSNESNDEGSDSSSDSEYLPLSEEESTSKTEIQLSVALRVLNVDVLVGQSMHFNSKNMFLIAFSLFI